MVHFSLFFSQMFREERELGLDLAKKYLDADPTDR